MEWVAALPWNQWQAWSGIRTEFDWPFQTALDENNRWVKLKGAFEHMYYYCVGVAIAGGTTDTQRNIVAQFGLQMPRSY